MVIMAMTAITSGQEIIITILFQPQNLYGNEVRAVINSEKPVRMVNGIYWRKMENDILKSNLQMARFGN